MDLERLLQETSKPTRPRLNIIGKFTCRKTATIYWPFHSNGQFTVSHKFTEFIHMVDWGYALKWPEIQNTLEFKKYSQNYLSGSLAGVQVSNLLVPRDPLTSDNHGSGKVEQCILQLVQNLVKMWLDVMVKLWFWLWVIFVFFCMVRDGNQCTDIAWQDWGQHWVLNLHPSVQGAKVAQLFSYFLSSMSSRNLQEPEATKQ